ncbi:MAG: hypothetical protein MUE75_07915 [Algoriphagus sp.]|nr:hypothetical protein [Algoriphagus sp.]
MQALLSLLFSKTFQKTAIILASLGTIGFGLSKSDFLTTEPEKIYGGSSYDRASQVIQAPDGGYFILGSTSSFGNGNYDVFLVKTDEKGLILWEKTYGGFFNEYGEGLALTSSNKSVTINGSQQVCTTPNVSESCVQERWKFEVDLDGNPVS